MNGYEIYPLEGYLLLIPNESQESQLIAEVDTEPVKKEFDSLEIPILLIWIIIIIGVIFFLNK